MKAFLLGFALVCALQVSYCKDVAADAVKSIQTRPLHKPEQQNNPMIVPVPVYPPVQQYPVQQQYPVHHQIPVQQYPVQQIPIQPYPQYIPQQIPVYYPQYQVQYYPQGHYRPHHHHQFQNGVPC